ncbi:hypothetical protein Taro_023604, partial [Colocasia esculenta]|nr:hypothetical protein [Colocasia esculenta]
MLTKFVRMGVCFGFFQEVWRSASPLKTGHGWDVKSVDWHPSKSLLVSGGKDNLVKLWDAKTGRELCSFHGHKNTVLCVKWNQNGNWVLTASKDQIIKLYDIRAMKELESFRGHRKDVTSLAWHPFHEEYFVSGSFDGSIFHWLVGHETPQVEASNAHEGSVWDLAWHPIGYILCSGSHDQTTKFWCRNRPGDPCRDKHSVGYSQGFAENSSIHPGRTMGGFPVPEPPSTPGPFAAARNEGTIPGVGAAMPLSMPSLDGSDQGDRRQALPVVMPVGAPPLPPGPHPSLLASGQQQAYQQIPHQAPSQQQHQTFSQQMAIQGSANQMISPLPQAHLIGLNSLQPGPAQASSIPPTMGTFTGGIANIQVPTGVGGVQNFQLANMFNRPQGGQVAGMNMYQSVTMDAHASGMGLGGNLGISSLPPPPPPHGSTPQIQRVFLQ